MSKGQGKWRSGTCSRCAYFGVSTPATTNLSGNPKYGVLYCQECADYINENWPPLYQGAERRSPPQTTHHNKEAT